MDINVLGLRRRPAPANPGISLYAAPFLADRHRRIRRTLRREKSYSRALQSPDVAASIRKPPKANRYAESFPGKVDTVTGEFRSKV